MPPETPSFDISIHEKLYEESKLKKQKQIIMKSEKIQKELDHCTFSPKVNAFSSPKSECVFERLSAKPSNSKELLHEDLREQKELNHCTFRPSVPRAQRRNSQSNIFENLYYQGVVTHSNLKEKSRMMCKQKIESEMSCCTFSPRTNLSNISSTSEHQLGTDVLDDMRRLYKQHDAKMKKLEMMRSQQLLHQIKGTPFTPKINSRSKHLSSNDGTERYETLYKDKEKKQQSIRKQQIQQANNIKQMTKFKAIVPTYLKSKNYPY
jgi:hypothetical protein